MWTLGDTVPHHLCTWVFSMFPRGHGAGVALLTGQCFGAPSCMFVTPRGSGRGRSSQGFGLRPPSCDHPAHCHRGRTSLRRSCWDVAGAARLPLRQRDIPTMRTPSEPDLRPSGPLTQRPIGSPPVGPAPGQQPPLPHSSDCLGLDIEVDEGPSLWPDLTSSPRLHWVLSLWNVGGLGSLVTMRKMAVTAWQSMLTAHPLTCLWLESANPPARPHATDPWARLRAGPVPTCRSVRLLLPLPLSSSVICWCKGLSRFPKATGGCLSQLQPCGVTSPDTKSSSGPWHLLKENGDVGGGGMSSSRWMRL